MVMFDLVSVHRAKALISKGKAGELVARIHARTHAHILSTSFRSCSRASLFPMY